MGKKRVAVSSGTELGKQSGTKVSRKRLDAGIVHIEATYNNTRVVLTDKKGGVVSNASSGKLGFKGAKKGTPFAAAKVGETVGEIAKQLGVHEIDVVVKGVGSGRESAIRAFAAHSGAIINSIKDRTPVPFNGPRPKKPRRV